MLPSAERSVNGASSTFNISKYREWNFFLDVTEVIEPSTLDLVIKTIDHVSGESFDIITFTQATGITNEMKTTYGRKEQDIVGVYTITAGTLTFSLGIVVKA